MLPSPEGSRDDQESRNSCYPGLRIRRNDIGCRGLGAGWPTYSSRRNGTGTAWFGLRLGWGLLALERRQVRLDARSLCSPCGAMGTGPLASRRRLRLVLDSGPLALA
jgi:hypothetical protein